ncbi:MAG: AraC family transcriptional regulator [Syntrophomonadaceae bacterium]|nr:AraC family transcriptional regulator [Syntrophomonadaceae bacterium]
MKDIPERVSYLQGLSEGLNISEGSPQGKIIAGMLGVLQELAEEVVSIKYDMETFKEYVENIDDDLFDLEERVFNSEDSDFYDEDDDVIEISCSRCGEELYFDADLLDDEDVIEIVCPECNEVVFVNDGSFDFEHANLHFDIDDEFENPSPS